MSARAKIRGFTGWSNFRLLPSTDHLSNVLTDLMTGYYLKNIIRNITGSECKKLTNMDNLSTTQRELRMQWVIEELQTQRVLSTEAQLEPKYCAIPSPDHIFDLLWRLVTYDIIFLWERFDFLMTNKDEILVKYKLNWVPEISIQANRKVKRNVDLLAGFGGRAENVEIIDTASSDEETLFDPFPSSSEMRAFKKNRPKTTPSPKDCIFEMINAILKALNVASDEINELVQVADIRVIVPLINYFFGDIFTADILLNDRWSINIALRTIEKLVNIESTSMKAEDIAEADKMATCSYLCAILMLGFKYRQGMAVLRMEASNKDQIKSMQRELRELKSSGNSAEYFKRYTECDKIIDNLNKELERLDNVFDMSSLKMWHKKAEEVSQATYTEIVEAMKEKFSIIQVPQTMLLNTFCANHVINLFLTNGVAFLLVENKQVVPRSTKIIVRDKANGKFYENISGDKESRNKLFKILLVRVKDEEIIISPESYEGKIEVFVEFSGGNRRLSEGTLFLYQVFPSNFNMYVQQLISAAKNGLKESVRTLLSFFSRTWPEFVNERDPKTGDTALHTAASVGSADMVGILLENFANVNIKNFRFETPLHNAMERFHRSAAQTLAEWGCDLSICNLRGETAIAVCKNETLVNHITNWSYYCKMCSERVAKDSDAGYLISVIKMHLLGQKPFVSLRSRVVAGSTLLHSACYLGSIDAVQELLGAGLDPNVTDFKGATPLHCTTDPAIAKMLLLAGANVNATDREGNTPLHLRAFGGLVVEAKNKNQYNRDLSSTNDKKSTEFNHENSSVQESSQIDWEEQLDSKLWFLLLDFSADFLLHNKRGLLPIHCAAMRGRVDAISFLLDKSIDPEKMQEMTLASETNNNSPSLTYLSLAYGYIECAQWLSAHTIFQLKPGEADELMQKLLTQRVQMLDLNATLKFILEQGADPNPAYNDGNSALHYAAKIHETVNPIKLLAKYGADVNRRNYDGCTPLTFSCRENNIFATQALLGAGADPMMVNSDGLAPFDVVPNLDEWINSGIFDHPTTLLFEKHILKQGQLLIHTIANRMDQNQKQSESEGPEDKRNSSANDRRGKNVEIIPANKNLTLGITQ